MDISRQNRELGVQLNLALSGVDEPWRSQIRAGVDAFLDRVGELAYVPKSWRSEVRNLELSEKNPFNAVSAFAMLRSANRFADGALTDIPLDNIPHWLDTATKRASWSALSLELSSIISPALEGYWQDAAIKLRNVEADAAFWNSPLINAAIATQETLRNLPATVGGAVGSIGSNLLGSFLAKGWPVLVAAAVAGGVWLYFRRK